MDGLTAEAIGDFETADALADDVTVAILALASIANQITTLREEIRAIKRELRVDVQGSLTP